MIEDDELRAMTPDERWRVWRGIEKRIGEIELEEGRKRMLAVPGRPSPAFAIGDHFRPSDGSTVYRVIHFAWEEGYGGYWRYYGYSEQARHHSHGRYVDHAVYYRCSLMVRCTADGHDIPLARKVA